MDNTPVLTPADRRRAISAGAIGNFIEWFDFIAYGSVAVFLAPLFFPSTDPLTSLLSVFAAFAVAFVARPLGGVIWGYIGDRWGRKAALSSGVLVMSGATACMGLLPTSETVGWVAALLLVILRCAQGLAAGAEWSGSAVFLVEFGDKKRRAFFASLSPTGASLGALAGISVVALLTAVLGTETVADWGWRILFLIAAPLGLVGFYIRGRLHDTPAFETLKKEGAVEKAPIREALRTHKKGIFLLFVMAACSNTATYAMVTFMVSYLRNTVGISAGTALFTNAIAVAFIAIGTLTGGVLADRFGRRPVYLWSVGSLVLLSVPMFMLVNLGNMAALIIGQCLLAFVIGSMLAPISVLCIELFPARMRYAASALGYSIGAGILGGASPLISTALIGATGSTLAPAFYLGGVSLIAFLIVAKLLRETVNMPFGEKAEDLATAKVL